MKTNKNIRKILESVSMFSLLKEDELIDLEQISEIYYYKEGENLFLEGEMNFSLIILVDGIVSIFKHDNKGNEIVIGYFTRYSLLAEAATLRHTPLPSSARFQADGAILKIHLEKFEQLFMKHPNISYALIQSLLKKVELLQQNIHFNIASTSSEKILHFYRQNPSLGVDLKQYEIASLLGMTPETFSRSIKKLLKDKKIIKTSVAYRILSS